MPKRASAFELILPPRPAGLPAFRWVYSVLRAEILQGRLRPGARLPATRELAQRYEMARGTMVAAFEQLRAEGYIEGSVGSGTYVSKVLPEELLQVAGSPAHRAPGAAAHRRYRRPEHGREPRQKISDFGRRAKLFPGYEPRASRAFRANVPALDLFPVTLWAQLAARRLRRVSARDLLGSDSLGYAPLRAAVADYLNSSRGVNCAAEQIAIVSGVQEALDLAARILLERGDRVCMEDPGYVGAVLAFQAAGAKISAARVDAEGMELRDRNLRGARLVYVTPGHQFPLGITMSLARRLALLEWARKSGGLIFEDDYDSEFRYAGRPVPALQGLDRGGRVLFAGSFSKVMFPSLRLGYLVIPEDLVPRFAAVKSLTNRHTPLLEQTVLCDFIGDGHFGRHLRRMREVYAARLATLTENARKSLAGLLELSPVEAGLQTVGWLCGGISADAAAAAAAKRNVSVTPLDTYSQKPMARQGLQLGFAASDEREIQRGVRELAVALAGMQHGTD